MILIITTLIIYLEIQNNKFKQFFFKHIIYMGKFDSKRTSRKTSKRKSRKTSKRKTRKTSKRKSQNGGGKRKRDEVDILTNKMSKIIVTEKKEETLIDRLIKKLKNLYIEEPAEEKEQKKIRKLAKELSIPQKQAHDNLKDLKNSMTGLKQLRRSPRYK